MRRSTDYAADLGVRGACAANATGPRHHLTPALLSKPVSMLTVKELRHWRNGLLASGLKARSVNRHCKSLKAALNLAASHDDRITNAKAWTVGLAAIPEDDDTESNLVLSDEQRRDVVASAYAISAEFGLYVEVHAATGARSGQIALLDVGDLDTGRRQADDAVEPERQEPPDANPEAGADFARPGEATEDGRSRTRCHRAAAADVERRTLARDAHRRPFIEAAQAARLPDGATIYCLRHTAITRALLAGVPVRLVASSFDTIGRDDREDLQQVHRRSWRRADAAGAVRHRRACGWQRRRAGAVIRDGRAASR